MFNNFYNFRWITARLERYRDKEASMRHVTIILLTVYIILGCLVVTGCTSTSSKGLYTAVLHYQATDNAMKVSPDGVSELEVRLGYFASCLKITTSESTSSMACSTNETTILLSDTNHFNTSQTINVDLFNFMVGTAKKFRIRCLDPWSLVVAIIFTFALIVCFAFTSPVNAKIMYKYFLSLSYFSLILSLVSAVWLETNITTATGIMNRMMDNYYTLVAEVGTADRGMLWASVAIQLIASILIGLLGILGGIIQTTEEDNGMDEKAMD